MYNIISLEPLYCVRQHQMLLMLLFLSSREPNSAPGWVIDVLIMKALSKSLPLSLNQCYNSVFQPRIGMRRPPNCIKSSCHKLSSFTVLVNFLSKHVRPVTNVCFSVSLLVTDSYINLVLEFWITLDAGAGKPEADAWLWEIMHFNPEQISKNTEKRVQPWSTED